MTLREQWLEADARSLPASLRQTATGAQQTCEVLLAHDLTPRSEVALVRAARLALERNGRLTVFHAIDGVPSTAIDSEQAHAERYLEDQIHRWLGPGKLSCRVHVGIGHPAQAISTYAQANHADLIVTGRHRRRLIADMFVGTTVEHLMKEIKRPILIVNNANQAPYRRVLIPVDLSEDSIAAIRFAADLVPEGASIHLFHVTAPSSKFNPEDISECSGAVARQVNEAIHRLIQASGLDTRAPVVTVKCGHPLTLIKEKLAEDKTDLVVLGTHAKFGIAHALSGGVVEAVLRMDVCDALLVPLLGIPERRSCASQPLTPSQASVRTETPTAGSMGAPP